jgi:hypothetical protein
LIPADCVCGAEQNPDDDTRPISTRAHGHGSIRPRDGETRAPLARSSLQAGKEAGTMEFVRQIGVPVACSLLACGIILGFYFLVA